jgi:serine/threonine protein kinase
MDSPGRPAVGATISHYRVLEKVGEGGMGTVWKAEDVHLQRTVALKFLHAADDVPRLLREAQAAASLSHPNICTVYEVDPERGFLAMDHGLEEHEGRVFIVMAFVEGESLDRRIRAGLRLGEALDIGIQMGEGLKAAHERGIVHRDVKSANVLVTAEGVATITDFGLALVRDRSRLTMPGTVMGTMTTMAPEQLRAEDADARTDVWALGVVLYEMCTGRLPFAHKDVVGLTRAIFEENAPRPTLICPSLPADLDEVVGKALAKAREDRYQHVDDLVADLRALRRRLTAEQEALGCAPELNPALDPEAPTASHAARSWLARVLRRG